MQNTTAAESGTDRDNEIAALHARIIALENMVVALLTYADDKALAFARELPDMITPRADATPHPLTLAGARAIGDLLDRAAHFRNGELLG